ncbi:rolling circle replication-associated protein [Demequina lutea]|uniref:Replication-associated protein ORF2/G2P domain-containing protein n=1 Tax=Demequina lutea TaxID=431489 RepID=A0A7Y9ZC12_9MICO|nr:hypothetical protein [Demequina lutea]NYI41408.1 hypothetical protein [Demequina lutea]
MSISTTAGPVARAVAMGPATLPGQAFGFSTRAVVDATADAVRELIGYEPTWLGADADIPALFRRGRGAVAENTRVTDRYTLTISGGSIAFAVKYARPWDNDSAPWRDTRATRNAAGQLEIWGDDEDADDEDGTLHRGTIKKWSVRSRLRMMKALADIDHDSWSSPQLRLSMVTLTLPDDWRAVAPRGADFKRMVRKFRWAWEREASLPSWQVVWKLEFQHRGAPHMHLMMRVPDEGTVVRGQTFRRWLSSTWAACVAADNWACHACGDGAEGQRCDCPAPDTEYVRNFAAGTNVDFGFRGTDPQRIAVYFLKHSSKTSDDKEYQHDVPPEWWEEDAGPGRFWGISGLERLEVQIEVPKALWQAAKRLARHLVKARNARAALSRRAHVVDGVSEATRRATLDDLGMFGRRRSRVLSDPLGGGWILSNDAPALVYRIAVFLAGRPPGNVPE